MKFRAMGEDRDEPDDDTRLAPTDSRDAEYDQGRYTDAYLETLLGPDAQQKRLLRLALDARTAEEEQGVNILYLALGFLTWFEDKSSSVAREAPLILLPAELVRNARHFDLRRPLPRRRDRHQPAAAGTCEAGLRYGTAGDRRR